MKYSFYATEETLCNFERIKEYITEIRKVKGFSVAKISLNDDNYRGFLKAVNDEITMKNLVVFGDDGYLYNLDFDGCDKLQKPDFNEKKIIKNVVLSAEKVASGIDYDKKMFNLFQPNSMNKTGNGILRYNKYVFLSQKQNLVVPFRFRKAKAKNQPLVIYFGGGGTLGHDNFKPLYEHLTIGKSGRLLKADCNILVPQFVPRKFLCEEDAREIYIEACFELLCEIIEKIDIDNSRIYIYGCSFGGGLVWNMLTNYSDIIAGAAEWMGYYYGYKSFDEIDFEAMAKVPIWLLHSSNDNVVKIDSDDKFYNELKKYNPNVKYTRFDKYGHKAAGIFAKRYNWADWLLSQRKSNSH